MKNILLPIVALGLFCQISCQRPPEEMNDMPEIKAVSFAGIDQKNVAFDNRNSTITITLPSILKEGLKPELTLSRGARVVSGLLPDNTVDLTSYCQCNPSPEKTTTLRISDGAKTSTYLLRIIQTGELKAIDETRELTFSRKTKRLEMSLPVENLYTNPSITTLTFTNVSTGTSTRINADAACLNRCDGNAPNQLMFSIGSPIEHDITPGVYSIALNGLKFPQRLVVTD